MLLRPFWINRIENAWQRAPIVWLTGVRRAGKTTLAKHWPDATFINCDLPRNRRLLAEPEAFLEQIKTKILVLDEVHRCENPSELLKIAADEFPHLRILATGSSTLAATKKFTDSLTGRTRTVHLCPTLASELSAFGVTDLKQRLQRGGLPKRLLDAEPDSEFYSEWLDSFYARDIQELFQIEKRAEFLRLCELLLRQSGELCSVTNLTKHSGVTRPTITSWLNALETTHFVYTVRPFHGGGRREILAQPKIFTFDTGFVCQARGWEHLRPEDCGQLLEHITLDSIRAERPNQAVHFWRDKQGREIDFIIEEADQSITTIECKWTRHRHGSKNLDAFRSYYPTGKNILVTNQPSERFQAKLGAHSVEVCHPSDLMAQLSER
jgi:predicted AAA+ superfamily ATPase